MFNSLPKELQLIIFEKFHKKGKFNFSFTSKYFYENYFLKSLGLNTKKNMSLIELIKRMKNDKFDIRINIKYIITTIPLNMLKHFSINNTYLNSLPIK